MRVNIQTFDKLRWNSHHRVVVMKEEIKSRFSFNEWITTHNILLLHYTHHLALDTQTPTPLKSTQIDDSFLVVREMKILYDELEWIETEKHRTHSRRQHKTDISLCFCWFLSLIVFTWLCNIQKKIEILYVEHTHLCGLKISGVKDFN